MPSGGTEQRKLAAIMFTDMVGYSALSQRNEALAQELLEEHRALVRSLFPRFNGTEIKTIGDAFLVEFHSALEAAQCAIEIQRTLAKRNHDVAADRRIDVRIGIHIGDVVHRDGDVYGDGVNIASRIQAVAGAGGICVSTDVERQIHNALEARLKKLAPTELKNIHVPMDLYRIVLPWEKDIQSKQAARTVGVQARRKSLLIWATAAFFVLAVIGGLVWWRELKTTAETTLLVNAAPTAKSVAVLPFVNMSPDKENEYLSDGVTEDLCTALSQIKGLHVPARTSSFVFKGKTEDIRKIGEQLNVGTILEGSVSKAGNKLRISAQLVNVADGFHLWTANYDREMTDILDIRSDLARRVVEALKVQLGVGESQRLVKKPTQNLKAYDDYLLGRFELNKFTEKGFTNSLAHFKQAIALDPKSVEINFFFAGQSFFERDFDRAIEQLQKTTSMDSTNAWTYHLLGVVFYQKRMLAEAFIANEKADSLEGIFNDPEMAEMRKAYETAGLAAYFRKENELRQRRITEGKYQSPLNIALNYAMAGADSEALDWLERAVDERTPWLPELKADPNWDAVRSQPRFILVLKRVGLEK